MKDTWKVGLSFAVMGVLCCLGLGTCVAYEMSSEAVTLTVQGKDRTTNSEGASVYRVYSKEGEVFEISDTLIRARFDSANEYAGLQKGSRYQCRAIGFRLPFLSTFRNLMGCRSIK